MSSNVDNTFIHRRRAQIFASMYMELGPVEAGQWVMANVPKEERDQISKYLEKEMKKYELTD